METLMNFRVPEDLKRKFQNLCNERKSTMSSSGSVKLRYENCLRIWGNAIPPTPPMNKGL